MKPAQPAPKNQEPAPVPSAPVSVRWRWIHAAIASVIVFAGSTLLAHSRTLGGWELGVFRMINEWSDSLRGFFVVATIAPESLWIATVVVVIVFLLKMYRLAWQLAVGTVVGYAVVYVTKLVIARPRPVELVQDVHARVHEVGMGFPSAHAMIVTVIVLTMWPYLPRGWRWGVAVLVPLMAISRVYLGVHAPLDVIGGLAVGTLVVACLRIVPGRLRAVLRLR